MCEACCTAICYWFSIIKKRQSGVFVFAESFRHVCSREMSSYSSSSLMSYFLELVVEAAVLAAFAWLRKALLDEPVPGADAAAKARSLPACFAATSAIRRADLSVIAFESSWGVRPKYSSTRGTTHACTEVNTCFCVPKSLMTTCAPTNVHAATVKSMTPR